MPDVGPGDDTTVRYVGGGGGGGVLLLPWVVSLGELTVSLLSSLDCGASRLLGCSPGDGMRGGGGGERAVVSSGVLALGGGLVGETTGGDWGDVAGEDVRSFDGGGGDVESARNPLSSGVD